MIFLYLKFPPMSQSIRPLSVGNVVSASIRLFRSHLGQFLGISLKAVGWMTIPWIPILMAFIVFATAMATFASAGNRNFGGLIAFGVLMIPVFLALLIFCSAKALTNEALISRLAFQDLMGQPESMAAAWQQVRKRTWHFWFARFMVVVILIAVSFAFRVLRDFLMVIPASIASSNGSSAMATLVVLIGVVIALVNYGVQLWFQARFFVPELPIAIEENVSGDQSIVRAWELSKGHAVRIAMVILVAGLITVPLFVLAFAPFIVTLLTATASMVGRGRGMPDPAVLSAIFGSLGLGLLLTFGFSIFTTPFWQTIKAVIYYDLRSRREGMGLELRER
jgi:hypothetical protein